MQDPDNGRDAESGWDTHRADETRPGINFRRLLLPFTLDRRLLKSRNLVKENYTASAGNAGDGGIPDPTAGITNVKS